jgi:hypothetical protein
MDLVFQALRELERKVSDAVSTESEQVKVALTSRSSR